MKINLANLILSTGSSYVCGLIEDIYATSIDQDPTLFLHYVERRAHQQVIESNEEHSQLDVYQQECHVLVHLPIIVQVNDAE